MQPLQRQPRLRLSFYPTPSSSGGGFFSRIDLKFKGKTDTNKSKMSLIKKEWIKRYQYIPHMDIIH